MKKHQIILVLVLIIGLVIGSTVYRNYQKNDGYKEVIETIQSGKMDQAMLTPEMLGNLTYTITNKDHIMAVQDLFKNLSWEVVTEQEVTTAMSQSGNITYLQLMQENVSYNMAIVNAEYILMTQLDESETFFSMSVNLPSDIKSQLVELFETHGE